jgi:S-adenosylmethionine decarboxylase
MIGKHCIITIKNIKNPEILNNIQTVKPLLDQIILDCNLNVVNEAGHQFTPFGVTYVYVLSESHLSIHTYPETSSAYMDIFCCSESFSPSTALESITKIFGKESKINFRCIDR